MQLTITDIQSAGQPWTHQSGDTMYPFTVTFDDGSFGEANSKSEVPPYQVGGLVEVSITGKTKRGVSKLKIQRPGAGFPAANTAPQAARPASAPQGAQRPAGAVFGATVGMAINQAIPLVEKMDGGPLPGDPEWAKFVWLFASDIIRVSQALEAGKLAPSAKDRMRSADDATLDPPPPPAAPAPRKNTPTKSGAAFDNSHEEPTDLF